tara:strand:- start:428 stop:868 length:441 start_codon:yes stop_codon:yes gene_type:complete
MSEQPKKPFQNGSDEVPSAEVPSAEAAAATELAAQAEATRANTDSITASPRTPAQPALKLATPRAAPPAAPAAPRPAAATPRPTAATPRPAAAAAPAAARPVAITPAARTEEASINVPMLVIDAIAAAVAIAFTVLLLQDLSPFLN